ncbi:MAG TPA: hypothetical protein VEL31_19345, partial [Ktedonobacteraceae bacterium]|nr:hypothetical protein [Ktedonobacteraceae bacterium]
LPLFLTACLFCPFFGGHLLHLPAASYHIFGLTGTVVIGYSPNQLRGYFPGLCQSVVTRYRIYVASRKEGRFRKELDALQQAICDLHEQGRYPSMKQVGKLLGKHGIFQNPEIRAFWQKTVRALGWGQ